MIKKLLINIWNQKINALLLLLLKPFYKNKELKKIIIFESHTNFDCNGGALYHFLIGHGFNKKYKIVWRVRDGRKYTNLPHNVVTVREDGPSLKKVYYYLNAMYFFSDNTMPKKPRKNQISVYCTHGGCTLKNVKGILTVRDDVDYVLSSSENYDPIMCENYSIPYPNKKMLHLGFPSNDAMFQNNYRELKKISDASFDKVILWMPTFRKNIEGREDSYADYPYGVPLFTGYKEIEELNKKLKSKNIHLIVKLHPYQDLKGVEEVYSMSNITVIDREKAEKADIDVYRMLSCADALISDYSSIAYSYILLNRPLAFVLSDFDEYKMGFAVRDPQNYLTGIQIKTRSDFYDFLDEISENRDLYKNERERLLDFLYEYHDGNSCKRIVNYFNL